jgi:tetratricopeptide (TPR) repeat protein
MSSKFDLDVVGVIEGTDKGSAFSFAWDYLRHYARLFDRFRDEPINVIEIGVAGGSSLKLWKAFFTRAHIVGVDIAPGCARFADDRVSIEIGSQDDPAFLARVCAKYPPTIIIDDGSHRADHIIYSFERMFPSLLPGGVYVVEDLRFHFGEEAKRWQGVLEQAAPVYFERIARSCMARSVQGAADAGTARYTAEHVDAIEFVRGALAVHKKAAARDIGPALEFADQYLRGRAPDAGAHERLSRYILKHTGPLDRAEAELRRAIELGGETASVLRVYVDVCQQQNRIPEAAAMAEKSASLSKEPEVWSLAGTLRTQHGDHAAAARAFRQAVALRPGNPGYAIRLSEALERQGNLAEALAAARQGLTAASGTPQEERLRDRVAQLRAKVGE